MSTTDTNTTETRSSDTRTSDLKLEVAVLPVADADRAKAFYTALGWREDADFPISEGFRVLQFTPPGSQKYSSEPGSRRAPAQRPRRNGFIETSVPRRTGGALKRADTDREGDRRRPLADDSGDPTHNRTNGYVSGAYGALRRTLVALSPDPPIRSWLGS